MAKSTTKPADARHFVYRLGVKGEHDWEFTKPGWRCRACKATTMDVIDLRNPDCKKA